MRLLFAVVVLTLCSCAAAGGAAGTAVVNTAIAVTVSGVRRAQGDCYTVCNPGSTCNRTTGLCDRLPCGGACSFDQHCAVTAVGETCVSDKTPPGLE
jgi:hypothetical protein